MCRDRALRVSTLYWVGQRPCPSINLRHRVFPRTILAVEHGEKLSPVLTDIQGEVIQPPTGAAHPFSDGRGSGATPASPYAEPSWPSVPTHEQRRTEHRKEPRMSGQKPEPPGDGHRGNAAVVDGSSWVPGDSSPGGCGESLSVKSLLCDQISQPPLDSRCRYRPAEGVVRPM